MAIALQLVGIFFVFVKSCIYKIFLLLNFYRGNDLKFTFEGLKKTFGKTYLLRGNFLTIILELYFCHCRN